MSGQCLLEEGGASAAQGVRVVGCDIAVMDLVLPLEAEEGGVDEHQATQQMSGSGGDQRGGHPAIECPTSSGAFTGRSSIRPITSSARSE